MKVLFFIFVTIVGLSSFADKPKVYTVGVENIYLMPYSSFEKNIYSGVLKEILDEFAKQEGIQFQYRPLPVTRLYADFYNLKIDFKIPANAYWQSDIKKKRNLKISYSDPVVEYIDGLFVMRSKKEFQLKKLGVIAGFTPWEFLGGIEKGKITKSENPNIGGLLQQLQLGRIDAAYVNIGVAREYIKNNMKTAKSLKFASDQPHTRSAYHFASIKHPQVVSRLNQFMKKNAAFMGQKKKLIPLD